MVNASPNVMDETFYSTAKRVCPIEEGFYSLTFEPFSFSVQYQIKCFLVPVVLSHPKFCVLQGFTEGGRSFSEQIAHYACRKWTRKLEEAFSQSLLLSTARSSSFRTSRTKEKNVSEPCTLPARSHITVFGCLA